MLQQLADRSSMPDINPTPSSAELFGPTEIHKRKEDSYDVFPENMRDDIPERHLICRSKLVVLDRIGFHGIRNSHELHRMMSVRQATPWFTI